MFIYTIVQTSDLREGKVGGSFRTYALSVPPRIVLCSGKTEVNRGWPFFGWKSSFMLMPGGRYGS